MKEAEAYFIKNNLKFIVSPRNSVTNPFDMYSELIALQPIHWALEFKSFQKIRWKVRVFVLAYWDSQFAGHLGGMCYMHKHRSIRGPTV